MRNQSNYTIICDNCLNVWISMIKNPHRCPNKLCRKVLNNNYNSYKFDDIKLNEERLFKWKVTPEGFPDVKAHTSLRCAMYNFARRTGAKFHYMPGIRGVIIKRIA